jgi:hypothetical protein
VIFVGGRAVALIDFDLAAPGSEVWDVACAARLWAPLRAEADVAPELRGRALERLALFADAYGLPARDRTRLVEALLSTHVWCYGIVYSEVRRGHETFGRVWADGGRGRAAGPQLDRGAPARDAGGVDGCPRDTPLIIVSPRPTSGCARSRPRSTASPR